MSVFSSRSAKKTGVSQTRRQGTGSQKGATRSGMQVASNGLGHRIAAVVKSVALLSLLVFSGFGLFKLVPYVNPDIQQVVVEGEIQRLDQAVLSQAVYENLSGGILTLDIKHLSTEIGRIPWVEQVEVAKHFPATLVVSVIEEQAIARWNDQGYISHRGEFIESMLYEDLSDLPQLSSQVAGVSPQQGAKQAIEVFHLLNSSVLMYEQSILALSQSASGGWTMLWDNGLSIDLGRTNHLTRIRYALSAWQRLPAETRQSIDRIDARYENGVAIRRQQDKQKVTEQRIQSDRLVKKIS